MTLPTLAMGIQNAMLRRVGQHRVRSTFITGMMANCAQGLAERKFGDFALYGSICLAFA